MPAGKNIVNGTQLRLAEEGDPFVAEVNAGQSLFNNHPDCFLALDIYNGEPAMLTLQEARIFHQWLGQRIADRS